MRQTHGPRKESLTDPFLTPPEAFVKDQLDLYQPSRQQVRSQARVLKTRYDRLGHQTRAPRRAAIAGTVRVRTMNVSMSSPAPMVKPTWAVV